MKIIFQKCKKIHFHPDFYYETAQDFCFHLGINPDDIANITGHSIATVRRWLKSDTCPPWLLPLLYAATGGVLTRGFYGWRLNHGLVNTHGLRYPLTASQVESCTRPSVRWIKCASILTSSKAKATEKRFSILSYKPTTRSTTMKKIIQLAAILLFLVNASCSSSGGDTIAPAPAFTWAAGIYDGTFTETGSTPDNVALIVTSTNRFALANIDGTEMAIGDASGASLTSPDGFTATLTAALSGTYTAPGVTGTFSLADAGLYNRTSSAAKLEGVWVDSFYTTTTGTTTWVIDATANVLMTSVSGCAATGTFNTIDTSKNEYTVTSTVTNCPGFNGVYNGFAFTDDDTFTDDMIALVIENTALQTFAIFAPIKQ